MNPFQAELAERKRYDPEKITVGLHSFSRIEHQALTGQEIMNITVTDIGIVINERKIKAMEKKESKDDEGKDAEQIGMICALIASSIQKQYDQQYGQRDDEAIIQRLGRNGQRKQDGIVRKKTADQGEEKSHGDIGQKVRLEVFPVAA